VEPLRIMEGEMRGGGVEGPLCIYVRVWVYWECHRGGGGGEPLCMGRRPVTGWGWRTGREDGETSTMASAAPLCMARCTLGVFFLVTAHRAHAQRAKVCGSGKNLADEQDWGWGRGRASVASEKQGGAGCAWVPASSAREQRSTVGPLQALHDCHHAPNSSDLMIQS
jgi:hypothetical protein